MPDRDLKPDNLRPGARDPSRETPLQNIPIHSELGRRIRNGFFAQPSRVLWSADYSDLELRILRGLSWR